MECPSRASTVCRWPATCPVWRARKRMGTKPGALPEHKTPIHTPVEMALNGRAVDIVPGFPYSSGGLPYKEWNVKPYVRRPGSREIAKMMPDRKHTMATGWSTKIMRIRKWLGGGVH